MDEVEEGVYELEFTSIGYAPALETDVRVVRGKTTQVRERELREAPLAGEETVVSAQVLRGASPWTTTPRTSGQEKRQGIERVPMLGIKLEL